MTEVLAGSAAPVADAPAANAVPAPDAPAVDQSANKEPVQPRTYTEDEHKQLVDQRVNERLTKERKRIAREARAEVERDFWREQAQKSSQPQPKPSEQPKGKPDPKDFQDWESYQDAMVDYKLELRESKRAEESKRTEAQQQSQRGLEQMAQQVQKAVSKAVAKYADFHEVIASIPPSDFTNPMTAYVANVAKDGGELAYYLGNNHEEAMRIAQLPDAQQIVEMHLLEAKIAAPPKPTQTPPPIQPGGNNAQAKKDYADMSTREHAEAYWKRKRR